MTAKLPPQIGRDEIVITRVFDAPRDLVFQAWIDPKHLSQWWGPRGFTCPRCEIDVRPGGIIRIDMCAPGGKVYPMSGVYLEILAPKRLTYTAGALDEKGSQLFELLNVVTFAERNGKTTLTIKTRVARATPEAAKYIGGFEAGMTGSLQKLADHLALKGDPLVIERILDKPAEQVWEALTNPASLRQWFFDLKNFQPELGCEFHFYGEKDGVKYLHQCRIIELISQKKLAYSWRYEGYPGNSTVTFELAALGGQTRLRLTHAGLETFPIGGDFARANFIAGWTCLLNENLKQFLSSTAKASTNH